MGLAAMTRRCCTLVALLCLPGSGLYADAFKWTDGAGQTHYSDHPPTASATVESIDTLECDNRACREAQERRWREAVELNREFQDWLDRLAAERERPEADKPTTIVYVPVYYPPQLPLAVVPQASRWPHRIAAPGRGTAVRPPPSLGVSHRRSVKPGMGLIVFKRTK